MKNNIDSNFAIAILALVAACVGFAFWFLGTSDNMETENTLVQSTKEVIMEERIVSVPAQEEGVVDVEKYNKLGEYTEETNMYNWLTYTDNELGFTLSYPPSWEVSGYNISKGVYLVDSVYENSPKIAGSGPPIGVSAYMNDENEQKYFVKTENGYAVDSSSQSVSNSEEFQVGDMNVLKYVESSGASFLDVYLVYNNTRALLLKSHSDEVNQKFLADILPSVRFTR